MANDTIKGAGDVYQKDLYGDLSKSGQQALTIIDAINKALVETTKINSKLVNVEPKDIKSISDINKGVEQTNKAFTQKIKLDKERVSLEAKLKAANSDRIQQNVELKVQLQEQNKINKDLAKEKLGLISTYAKESKRLNDLRKRYKDLALSEGETSREAKKLIKEIQTLDTSLKKVDSTLGQSQRNVGNYASALDKVKEEVNELNKAEKIAEKIGKEKLKLQKDTERARLSELKLQKDREKAFDKFEKQLQKQNKEQSRAAKIVIDNANAYKILTKQTNEAQSEFKRLAAEFGVNSKQAQKANIKFTQLDNRLRAINKVAKDGRRDVGRYGIALREAGVSLKSLFFAGGVIGAIRGIGRAFGDAFERVRSFDKELQNIAGITGTTRAELKDVEKAIISVAGSSIKTSNEVAQLASTLFTLGNSEREVKLLLKPVNDLSIALGATSEEAADFLGQTLNAFGKGAESGQEFADIIANVRTSTSLDFQRIKDALGFVAPTANALGLSLGQVSAQIGVLQDNGIKAARAGRLLNSSFARLVKQGKTLDDALKEINESQNKVATATELFGAESFTLGLILADNIDKTKEYANEFDNLSDGSLKKLTDEQLKSLDAQLKILDSTWEKFLLSLDNGESVIGDLTRGITGFLGAAITGLQNLDLIAKSTFNGLIKFREEELSRTLDGGWVTETGVNINKIREEFDKIPLKQIGENVDKVREAWIDLLGEDRTDAALLFTQYIRERVDAEKDLSKESKINTEIINENTGAKSKNAKKTTQLTGLIEKQSKVLADLSKQIQEAKTEELILNLSIQFDVEQDELERLRRIVSSSLEEADNIERQLIEDSTERRIAQEIEKSEKLIQQIISNSRIETEVKERLISDENKRLAKFVDDEEIRKGKAEIKRESDLARATFEIKRTGFKTEAAFEKEKDAQFLAIKKNSLEAELKLLEQFGGEETKVREEQIKAELQGLIEFNKTALQDFSDIQKAILDKIEESVAKRSERTLEEIDKQITNTEKRQDQLRELANRDVLGADKSFAAEEKRRAELERQRQEEERKQELKTAGFKILSALLEQGKSPQEAIPEVGVLLGALPGIIESLPTFIEGTKTTVADALGKPHLNTSKDGYIIRADGKEKILNPEQSQRTGGRTTEDITKIVEAHDKGMLNNLYQFNQPNNDLAQITNWQSNAQILRKFDSLQSSIVETNSKVEKAIKNQPVLKDVDYHRILKQLTVTMNQGNKETKTRSSMRGKIN